MEKDYVQILIDGITQIVDAKIAAASSKYTAVQEATIVENQDRDSGQYTILLDGARRLANVTESQSGVVFYLQDQVYVGNLGGSSDLVILGKKVTADTAPMIVADPFVNYIRFLKTADGIKDQQWVIYGDNGEKADILTIALDSRITNTTNPTFGINITATTKTGNVYRYQLAKEDFLGSLAFTDQIIRYATIDVSNLPSLTKVALSVTGEGLEVDWNTSFMELGKTLSDASEEEVFIWAEDEQYTYSTNKDSPETTDVDLNLQYVYLIPGTSEYRAITSVTEEEDGVSNCIVYWERLDLDGVNWINIDTAASFKATIPLRKSADKEEIRVRLERVNLETAINETLYSNTLIFTNEKETEKQYIDTDSFELEHLTSAGGGFPLWNITGQIVDKRDFMKTYSIRANYKSIYSDDQIFDAIKSVSWTYPGDYLNTNQTDSYGQTTIVREPIETTDLEVKSEWLSEALKFDFYVRDQSLVQAISEKIVCKIEYKDEALAGIEATAPLYFTKQSITGDSLIVNFYHLDKDGNKIYTTIFPTDNGYENPSSGQAGKIWYSIEPHLYNSVGAEIDLSKDEIAYEFLNNGTSNKDRVLWDSENKQFALYKNINAKGIILRVTIQKSETNAIALTKDIPIPVYNMGANSPEELPLIDYSGPTIIEYDSSGLKVSYDSSPLELLINQGELEIGTWYHYQGIKEVKYRQYVDAYPTIETSNGKSYLIPKNYYEKGLEGTYDYSIVLKDNDTIKFVQPIIIHQSSYISSLINEWDGGYKVTDSGQVMTPALIAGSKDSKTRTFTGVVAGDFKGVTKDGASEDGEIEAGILGYQGGQQSFGFLSDGTAFLGKSGQGRIEFDGNKGTIQSGNFNGEFDANGNLITKKEKLSGSYFGLTDGKLITGDGVFKGHIEAGSGTFTGRVEALEGSIAGFEILEGRFQHSYKTNEESLVDFFIRPAGNTAGKFIVGDSEAKTDWRIWLQGDKGEWKNGARVGRFGVDASGGMYSTSGQIAGFKINNNELVTKHYKVLKVGAEQGSGDYADGEFRTGLRSPMDNEHRLNDAALAVGIPKGKYWSDAPFFVTFDGVMHATGADIEGTITATTGEIGSGDSRWKIGEYNGSFSDFSSVKGIYSQFKTNSNNDSIIFLQSDTTHETALGIYKKANNSFYNRFAVNFDGTIACSGLSIYDKASEPYIEGLSTFGANAVYTRDVISSFLLTCLDSKISELKSNTSMALHGDLDSSLFLSSGTGSEWCGGFAFVQTLNGNTDPKKYTIEITPLYNLNLNYNSGVEPEEYYSVDVRYEGVQLYIYDEEGHWLVRSQKDKIIENSTYQNKVDALKDDKLYFSLEESYDGILINNTKFEVNIPITFRVSCSDNFFKTWRDWATSTNPAMEEGAQISIGKQSAWTGNNNFMGKYLDGTTLTATGNLGGGKYLKLNFLDLISNNNKSEQLYSFTIDEDIYQLALYCDNTLWLNYPSNQTMTFRFPGTGQTQKLTLANENIFTANKLSQVFSPVYWRSDITVVDSHSETVSFTGEPIIFSAYTSPPTVNMFSLMASHSLVPSRRSSFSADDLSLGTASFPWHNIYAKKLNNYWDLIDHKIHSFYEIDGKARGTVFSAAPKENFDPSYPMLAINYNRNAHWTTAPFYVTYSGNLKAESLVGNTTLSTDSDERLKQNILSLNDNHDQFFDRLKPKSYQYLSDTDHNRLGYIAQDVIKALRESGLQEEKMGLILQNQGYYNLCYNDFIPLNTWQIQKLKSRATNTEIKIKELENEIEKLKALLSQEKKEI